MKDFRALAPLTGTTPSGPARGWPFVVRPDLDWLGQRGTLNEPPRVGRAAAARPAQAHAEQARADAGRSG